jgi:ferredoxin
MNKYKAVKLLRVISGISVLLVFMSIFFISRNALAPVAGWQALPVSIRTFADFGIVAACTLFVVILFTLLLGRVYCSFFCPLGIFQDIFIRFSRLIKFPKRKRIYTPNHKVFRYSIFLLLAIALLFGLAVPISLFGPFAVFGRLNAAVIKPIFNWINNYMVDNSWFESLYPLKNKPFSLPLVITGTAFAALVAIAAFLRGRIFCNTLCPVGALLGVLSKYSWFKVSLDNDKCVKCGKCAKVCKSNCIDFKNYMVDNERCVACFNCTTACNFDAVKFSHGKTEKPVKTDLSKRDFFVIGGSALIGAAVLPAVLRKDSISPRAVMPPGAMNLEHFSSKCTACQLCVSNCPGRVLKPAALEYGAGGFLQPHLDFSSGMCEYECNNCSNICPNGALIPQKLENKKRLQIGLAKYYSERCVVVTDRTYCGACAEHCPTGAVHMVDWEEGLTIPKVEQELCIGCGACEYICPVRPEKAIIVFGNKEQGTAKVAKTKQVENHLEGQDFPF